MAGWPHHFCVWEGGHCGKVWRVARLGWVSNEAQRSAAVGVVIVDRPRSVFFAAGVLVVRAPARCCSNQPKGAFFDLNGARQLLELFHFEYTASNHPSRGMLITRRG